MSQHTKTLLLQIQPSLMLEVLVFLGSTGIREINTFSVSLGVSNDLLAKLTQRTILTSVSSVYDPLGLVVTPFTIRGRIILKEMWCCLGQSWDTFVPQNINNLFHEWNGEKDNILHVKLARCIFTQSNHSNIEFTLLVMHPKQPCVLWFMCDPCVLKTCLWIL